jgi:hypothetical protein
VTGLLETLGSLRRRGLLSLPPGATS